MAVGQASLERAFGASTRGLAAPFESALRAEQASVQPPFPAARWKTALTRVTEEGSIRMAAQTRSERPRLGGLSDLIASVTAPPRTETEGVEGARGSRP